MPPWASLLRRHVDRAWRHREGQPLPGPEADEGGRPDEVVGVPGVARELGHRLQPAVGLSVGCCTFGTGLEEVPPGDGRVVIVQLGLDPLVL